MKVVVTGFEPFGGYTHNTSWVVAEEVVARGVSGVKLAKHLLPVSFANVAAALRAVVEQEQPDLLILLGQAGGSDRIKLERVALNLMDAKLPDNDGYQANEESIAQDGPMALITSMPIKELLHRIIEAGYTAKISNSCGLYVCNRTYYEALMLCRERPSMQALFVHLPCYEEQPDIASDKPTMTIDAMAETIRIIIQKTNDKHNKT